MTGREDWREGEPISGSTMRPREPDDEHDEISGAGVSESSPTRPAAGRPEYGGGGNLGLSGDFAGEESAGESAEDTGGEQDPDPASSLEREPDHDR